MYYHTMASQKQNTSSNQVCPICGKGFGSQGLGNHQCICLLSTEKQWQNKEYEGSLEEA
jgi:hypothetical protein